MRKFGIALIAFGIFCAALAFDMNVSVGTIYNVGLLNNRQNVLFVSGVLFLAGIILLGFSFSKSEEVKNLNKFIFICSLPTLFFLLFKGYITIQEYAVEQEIAQQEAIRNREIAEEKAKQEVILTEAKKAEEKVKEETENRLKENTREFIDNGDGTVTHTKTKLMWQRCSVGQEWTGTNCTADYRASRFGYYEATTLSSNFANHYDWHLPTNEELKSLIYCPDGKYKKLEQGKMGNICESYEGKTYNTESTINNIIFPNTPFINNGWYWSSSINPDVPQVAWYVGFNEGMNYAHDKTFEQYVRLVRSAK